MGQPSNAMQEMYKARKADTLKRISDVIDEMEEMGEKVTKKALIERTGLSSGTFSKPHVIELLKERHVCQFASKAEEIKENSIQQTLKDHSKAMKRIEVLEHRIDNLEEARVKDKERRQALEAKNKELEERNAYLRGERQMLLERIKAAGVGLGEIKLVK